MVDASSIAADTSGKVFLHSSARGRSKKKWKRSWLLADNGPVGSSSGCRIGIAPRAPSFCHIRRGTEVASGRPLSGRVVTKASLMLMLSADLSAPSGRV